MRQYIVTSASPDGTSQSKAGRKWYARFIWKHRPQPSVTCFPDVRLDSFFWPSSLKRTTHATCSGGVSSAAHPGILFGALVGRPRCFLRCQADDISSSDDDRSEDFDSGGGVANLLRDLSVSSRTPAPYAREEHAIAKQVPEESNVLDSFDLPEDALQDKVPPRLWLSGAL